MPASDSLVVLAGLLAAVAAAAAAAGGVIARGSTAVPAAAWGVAAAVAFGLEAEARRVGWLDPPTASAARLVVVALATCPAMSLLGAKRPQHGVWQFIVLALGVTLAMPAVSTALIRPGTPPDVHLVERWFILGLVAVGWLNFAATRHGAAATLVAAGQVLLARPFLPGSASEVEQPVVDAIGAGMAAGGSLLAAVQSWSGGRRGRSSSGTAAGIDAAFMAVRETFGAAWAVRIAERFDAIAASRGWPCRLSFAGLRVADDAGGGHWQRDASRAFRALARRFVSDAWLSRHGCDDQSMDRPGNVG